jgi:hypothetical protein
MINSWGKQLICWDEYFCRFISNFHSFPVFFLSFIFFSFFIFPNFRGILNILILPPPPFSPRQATWSYLPLTKIKSNIKFNIIVDWRHTQVNLKAVWQEYRPPRMRATLSYLIFRVCHWRLTAAHYLQAVAVQFVQLMNLQTKQSIKVYCLLFV